MVWKAKLLGDVCRIVTGRSCLKEIDNIRMVKCTQAFHCSEKIAVTNSAAIPCKDLNHWRLRGLFCATCSVAVIGPDRFIGGEVLFLAHCS